MRWEPLAGALVLLAGEAAAAKPCLSRSRDGTHAACMEWSFFDTTGVSVASGHGSSPTVGLGAELSLLVLRYHGFPSGSYGGHDGDAEVSVGPFALASLREAGGVLEGGLAIHDGGGWHSSWGSFDLRVGAGYGQFPDGRAPHLVWGIGYGVRSALYRYPGTHWSTARARPLFGQSDVARLSFLHRRPFGEVHGYELVFGIELSPTFFLPPLSWWRVAGGPPR